MADRVYTLKFNIDIGSLGTDLKNMLNLFQNVGKQLEPLLNAKATADFSQIEQAAKSIASGIAETNNKIVENETVTQQKIIEIDSQTIQEKTGLDIQRFSESQSNNLKILENEKRTKLAEIELAKNNALQNATTENEKFNILREFTIKKLEVQRNYEIQRLELERQGVGRISQLTQEEYSKLVRSVDDKYKAMYQSSIASLNNQEQAVKKLKISFESLFFTMSSIGMIAGIITSTFSNLVNSYITAEQSERKLEQAMRSRGIFTQEAFEQSKNYSKALQEEIGISDDLTNEIQAKLIVMGVEQSQLKKATELTLDLATAMGTDGAQAVRVIADSFEGNAGMLKRYVKGLDETDIKQRGMIAILSQLESAVGGQARAVGQGAVGEYKKFQESLGDTKEMLGKVVLEGISPLLSSARGLLNIFQEAPTPIKSVSLAVLGLAGSFRILNLSMGPVFWAIGAVIAVGAGLISFYKAILPESDKLKISTENLANAFKNLTDEQIKLKIFELKSELMNIDISELALIRTKEKQIKLYENELQARQKANVEAEKNVGLIGELQTAISELQKKLPILSSKKDIAETNKLIEAKQKELDILQNLGKSKVDDSRKTSEQIIKIEGETQKAILDYQEALLLSQTESGASKLQIQKLFSLERLKNEEETEIKSIDKTKKGADEIINAIKEKYEAQKGKTVLEFDVKIREIIVKEQKEGFSKIESSITKEISTKEEKVQSLKTKLEIITDETAKTQLNEQINKLQSEIKDLKIQIEPFIPEGSIINETKKINDELFRLQAELNVAQEQLEKDTVLTKIEEQERLLARTKMTSKEILADEENLAQKRIQEWENANREIAAGISAIGEGFGSFWQDLIVDSQERADKEREIETDILKQKSELAGAEADLQRAMREGAKEEEILNLQERVQNQKDRLKEMEKAEQEFHDVMGRAWKTTKGVFLSAIGDMLKEWIKTETKKLFVKEVVETTETGLTAAGTTARIVLKQAEQTEDLKSAGTKAVEGASSAGASVFKTMPWFIALPLAAIVIAGVMALFRSIKFGEGGKITQKTFGLLGEKGENEFVAPEKTFYDVAREEIIPMFSNIAKTHFLKVAIPEIKNDYAIKNFSNIENIKNISNIIQKEIVNISKFSEKNLLSDINNIRFSDISIPKFSGFSTSSIKNIENISEKSIDKKLIDNIENLISEIKELKENPAQNIEIKSFNAKDVKKMLIEDIEIREAFLSFNKEMGKLGK